MRLAKSGTLCSSSRVRRPATKPCVALCSATRGDRVVAPLFGKDYIFRRTHVINHLYVGLRSMLSQPAAHRHDRCHTATGGQQQEFIFRFIVAGKLAHRIGQPKVIAAFDLAGQPLRTRTLVNTANGQRNVFADPGVEERV